MPFFVNDPRMGTRAHMTAGERLMATLTSGLPDTEITAPIHAWNSPRVAEFGAPLAGVLVDMERDLEALK